MTTGALRETRAPRHNTHGAIDQAYAYVPRTNATHPADDQCKRYALGERPVHCDGAQISMVRCDATRRDVY